MSEINKTFIDGTKGDERTSDPVVNPPSIRVVQAMPNFEEPEIRDRPPQDPDNLHPVPSREQQEISSAYRRLKSLFNEVSYYDEIINGMDENVVSPFEAAESISQLRKINDMIRSTSMELLELNLREEDKIKVGNAMRVHTKNFLGILDGFQRIAATSETKPSYTSSSQPKRTVKLPDFKLPTFNGSQEDWIQWKETFRVMIHENAQLDRVSKFHYLRTAMNLPAGQKSVIDNFAQSESCYESAWKALCKRYDDPKQIIELLLNKLLTVKKMSAESVPELRRIIDEYSSIVTSLKLNKVSLEQLLVHLVELRLDDVTLRDWKKEVKFDDLYSFQKLMEFLSDQCFVVRSSPTINNKRAVATRTGADARGGSASKTFAAVAISCVVCKEAHYLHQCQRFKATAVAERIKMVNQSKMCRNCFSTQHFARDCTSNYRCRVCNERHHTLLHVEKNTRNSSEAKPNYPIPPPDARSNQPAPLNPAVVPYCPPSPPKVAFHPRSNVAVMECHNEAIDGDVYHEALLTTACVYVMDSRRQWIVARALLDSGAQGYHVTSGFVRKLGIPLVPVNQTINGVNGQTSLIKHQVNELVFASMYQPFTGTLVGVFVSDDITGLLPNRRIDTSRLNIPPNIYLADPNFNKPGKIDLLLGIGVYHDVLMTNKIRMKDSPLFLETALGWIVGGSFPVPLSNVNHTSTSLICCYNQPSNSGIEVLDQKLDQLMELDNAGLPSTKILSPEQSYCLELFDKTTRHDEEKKKVTVMYPVKQEISEISSNYGTVARQFYYHEKKRQADFTLNETYVKYFEEDLVATGRMTPTLHDENNGHFLPHHPVVKTTSSTHRVRPVWNASLRTKDQISLNDCLCTGPIVQSDLFTVLLRFREGAYVLKSDVAKMYLQIDIDESQRKFQKALWRRSPTEQLKHYTLNCVTFGLAPSAFLATNTLLFASKKYAKEFPKACEVIADAFYVDDFVYSFNDLQSGLQIRDEVREILSKISFPMRKWSSNDRRLLVNINEEDIEVVGADSVPLKTLGITYNPENDVITFPMKVKTKVTLTKADLLSEVASFFDPLGWIGPVVVVAKLHMKKVRKLKWNEPLPDDVQNSWEDFRSKLPALDSFQIQRHAVIVNPVTIMLHGFSDASQEAYGAVFYIRSSDAVGNIQISLLCSKSRVSPPKLQTIARLELCAATLMTKMLMKIAKAMSIKVDDVVLWSDSIITLFWIVAEPSTLSVFVGHRVNFIQENSKNCCWRHIPSELMPADKLSRGLQPDEIGACDIWNHGPAFLRQNRECWPETMLEINGEDKNQMEKEVRKTLVARPANPLLTLIETRFSSLQKVINCVAYLRRLAVDNTNANRPLSIDEIDDATDNIVRILQKTFFFVEYRFFLRLFENPQSSEKFPKTSPLLQLKPIMNHKKIICVGGRLSQSPQLTEGQKHPVILPKCHFSKLIVRFIHKERLHPGNGTMLSLVREAYWILGAKTIIRQIRHECLSCFKFEPQLAKQIMADLPAERVTMKPPFDSVAVDYCGHVNYRASTTKRSTISKAYIAVFKCMATGAMHFEAVTSLSTPAFIMTFDRFIARRGLCSDVFSDNGTNFVGANNEFRQILTEVSTDLEEFLKRKSIRWHFTTPLAPHAGGYYESGVKTMKHHLVRECAGRSFDFEQLTTILCRAEAIVNSRPLIPLSNDPDDFRVLTPADFLIGRSMVTKPERNVLPVATNRLDRFNQLQQIHQKLWNIWYHDYLHHLQTRPKHFREVNEFRVGDLVLLKDPNLPPLQWIRGRIIKLLPDKHGETRNVILKTKNGEKQRNIRYLAYLPTAEEDDAAARAECSQSEDN